MPKRINAKDVILTYICPKLKTECCRPINQDDTWYDNDLGDVHPFSCDIVIFKVDCPCGETHEITL
jgi:hypothetical protein